MKNVVTKFGSVALICLLAVSMLLTACSIQNGNTNDPEPPKPYTVTVQDFLGNGVTGVIVALMQNGTQVVMNSVDVNGVATFADVTSGEYDIELRFIGAGTEIPYHYDTDGLKINEQTPAKTVVLYNKLKNYETFFKDEIEYRAGKIADGGYYSTVRAGEMTYFVFRPTRAGQYEIGYISDLALEIGTYGAPFFVLDQSTIPVENGVIKMDVLRSYIGETEETTTATVIGVKSAVAGEFVLTVKRVGDIPREQDDIWNVMSASPNGLRDFEVPEGKTLTDLNINDPNLKVVLGEDGYYHLNDANGPLVFVRVTSASQYLAALSTVCETDRLGALIYDGNGNYLRREDYTPMVLEYAELCNRVDENDVPIYPDGACPLTQDMVNMLQTVGAYKGWWNPQHYNYLFTGIPYQTDMAWLFACCYYA